MNRISILILAAILCGCGATAPVMPEVKTVYVPTPTPCISKLPESPSCPYGKGALPTNSAEKARILAECLEASEAYGKAWEAATIGCEIPKDPFK